MDTATYYAQLEQGARYLASLTSCPDERQQHLSWANRYYQLRIDAAPEPPLIPIAA